MKRFQANYLLFLGFTFLLLHPIAGDGAEEGLVQARVALFGQPCRILAKKGKFTPEELKVIHSLSPGELPLVETADQAKKALKKIQATRRVPSVIQEYVRSLKRYLKGELSFFIGLEKILKGANPKVLFETITPHVEGKDLSEMKLLAEQLKGQNREPDLIFKLIEAYRKLIGPNPEEEFHRTIEKAQISYRCSFEVPEESEKSQPEKSQPENEKK